METIEKLPENAVREQREAYQALRRKLGSASDDEVRQVLAEREPVAPEPDLDPEVAARVRQRIGQAREESGASDGLPGLAGGYPARRPWRGKLWIE